MPSKIKPRKAALKGQKKKSIKKKSVLAKAPTGAKSAKSKSALSRSKESSRSQAGSSPADRAIAPGAESSMHSMKRNMKASVSPAALEKHGRSMAHRNADSRRRTAHKPVNPDPTPIIE